MSVIGGQNIPVTNGLAYVIDFNNNYVSGSSTVIPILYTPTPSQFTGSVPNLVNNQVQFTGTSVLRSFQTFPGFSATQGNMTLMFSGESKNSNVLFTQDGTVAVVSTTSSIGYGVPVGNLGRNFPNTGFDHVTLRFSSASVDCFINGIPVSASGMFPTVPSSSTFNDFKIGGNYINAWTGSFSGSLGQLMVYNRVLTDDEIYSNYLIQARRYGLPEPIKPYTVDSSVYVYTQAIGITGSATIAALDTFVRGLKSASLWEKMIAIYPFIGTSASASRLNLKDVSLNTTQVNYSGSWSTSLSGSYNNNTSSYGILSNITPTYVHPLINSQSIHLSYLSYDTPVSGGYLMGVEQIPGLPGDIAAPAAAYSVRKVRTAYTGSALRVRRDSDDLSFDVGFDVSGNLDTGSLLTRMTASLNTPALPGDYSGLAAAYSLRRVSSSYSGYAIEVRRAVDNYSASIGFDGSGNLNTGSLASFIRTGSETPISNYSGLLVAYSLRKVVPTYGGSAIEIRSGSVSQSIGFDSFGDLDVTAIRSFAGSGDAFVKTWFDQSGNNYHVSQSDAVSQPKIYSGSLQSVIYQNGKPTVEFDGINDRLENNGFSGSIYDKTLAAVCRFNEGTQQYGALVDSYRVGPVNINRVNLNRDNDNLGSLGVTLTNGFTLYKEKQILSFATVNTSGNSNWNINSASVGTGTHLTGYDGISLGALQSGGYIYWAKGNIQEVLFYTSSLSSSRASIENNINSYYGIYTPTGVSTENAFVKTWYDQSGNNNHATQAVTSSQPLIVDNGVIVTENGKPALSFNGVNDFLTSSFTYNINTLGIQKVERWRNLNNGQVSTNFSPTSGPYLQWIQNNQTFENYYIGAQTDSPATTTRKLYSFYTRLGFYENGTLTVSRPNVSSETVNSVVIGAYGESILPASVNTQELIIYSSNITSSKGLIEDNINGYYNIFTQSLASGSGYVTTWYDQSGNNRHATQSVATDQPLILSSGSINTLNNKPALSFDGDNDFLSIASLTNTNSNSVFHVVKLMPHEGTGAEFPFNFNNDRVYYTQSPVNTFQMASNAGNFAIAGMDTLNLALNSMFYSSNGSIHQNGILKGSSLSFTPLVGTFTGFIGNGINNRPDLSSRMITHELLYYTSSQTTNRQPIEQNINTYFNIFTPTGINSNTNSLSLFSSPTLVAGAANAAPTQLITGGPEGLITVSRTGSGDYTLWKNRVPTKTSLPPSVPQSQSIYLNAANVSNAVFSGSQNTVAYASVGAGLTDSDVYTYYELVDNLQTGLGRRVPDPTAFITTWDTRISGTGTVSNTSSIVLPFSTTNPAVTASWGDGTVSFISQSNQLAVTHSYVTPGIYTVTVTGTHSGFRFGTSGDRAKILNIDQWGGHRLTTGLAQYQGCFNLTSMAADAPSLASLDQFGLQWMFQNASNFNGYINNWDTSNLQSLSQTFRTATRFNSPLDRWNVSRVTAFNLAFNGASSFNQPINTWRFSTSSAVVFNSMFSGGCPFNQNIGSWNVERVTGMSAMFQGNSVFNNGRSSDINNWRPISCSDFTNTFYQAYAFNQPVGNWTLSTGSTIDMNSMFYQASSFNQNIGAWDVSKVTNMNQMFFSATAFNNSGSNSIRDWRPISCSNFNGMFQNCSAFNQPINWPLSASNVTMSGMFNSCVINQPLTWDTRNVTNMSGMFAYAGQFNQNIGSWNVERVISMNSMFLFAGAFNNSGSSDINNWRPISCSNFSSMFQSATAFNQPIGNWPLSASNINMTGMFLGSSFNQDISTWDTSRVINMNSMFRGASSFNQPIENWDVSNVVDMTNMFYDPINFSRPIGIWNVGNVTSMNRMFYNNNSVTRPFNENIGAWNVSKVTNFADMFRLSKFNNTGSSDINNWTPVSCSNFNGMFQSATIFNQPIEGWTLPTDRTYTMQDMFSGATSFNQPLGNWNIVSCSNMSGMLNSCGMDINNYSQTLQGWASQPSALIPRNITLGATGRQYTTPGSASRAILIADYNWTITGDTYVPL